MVGSENKNVENQTEITHSSYQDSINCCLDTKCTPVFSDENGGSGSCQPAASCLTSPPASPRFYYFQRHGLAFFNHSSGTSWNPDAARQLGIQNMSTEATAGKKKAKLRHCLLRPLDTGQTMAGHVSGISVCLSRG